MDREVLSEVLGRRVWPRDLTPGLLRGHRRRSVRDAGYPVVLPQRGAFVRGVILGRVTARECDRLSAYEGDGYELARGQASPSDRPLRGVLFFKPKPGAFAVTLRPWSPAGWCLLNKASKTKALASARSATR
jgi:hypothetical protein